MADQLRRRNHYLPEFYLNYFLSKVPPGTLWVYDKKGERPKSLAPRVTAVEKDFYIGANADGSPDDSIERAFADLEGKAKPVMDRWLEKAAVVEDQDREAMVPFVSLMYGRVPKLVEVNQEAGAAMAEALMEHIGKKSPDEFERLVRAAGIGPGVEFNGCVKPRRIRKNISRSK